MNAQEMYGSQDELIELRIPATIYDIYTHPLLGFSLNNLAIDLENATDLGLTRVPIFPSLLERETKTATIAIMPRSARLYREVAQKRGCSVESLMNSALAVWLEDYWYEKGDPKPFQQICKRIITDSLYDEDPLWPYIFKILETHRGRE